MPRKVSPRLSTCFPRVGKLWPGSKQNKLRDEAVSAGADSGDCDVSTAMSRSTASDHSTVAVVKRQISFAASEDGSSTRSAASCPSKTSGLSLQRQDSLSSNRSMRVSLEQWRRESDQIQSTRKSLRDRRISRSSNLSVDVVEIVVPRSEQLTPNGSFTIPKEQEHILLSEPTIPPPLPPPESPMSPAAVKAVWQPPSGSDTGIAAKAPQEQDFPAHLSAQAIKELVLKFEDPLHDKRRVVCVNPFTAASRRDEDLVLPVSLEQDLMM